MNLQLDKSFLCKSSSNALRIIFELMVLFHHLYVTSTVLGERIDGLSGVVAVGGFLIVSGFGVGVSYLEKGDAYCEKLLKKRIPKTYFIILIANLFYLGLYYYTGNAFENFFDLVISVLYLPVFSGFVALSHYIYFLADLIIYYALFCIFSYLFRKERNPLVATAIAIIIVDLVIIAVLTVINAETGSNRHLRACLCFPLGLLLACAIKDGALKELLLELKWTLIACLFAFGVAIYAVTDDSSVMEYVMPILIAFPIIALFFGVEFKNKAVDYASQSVIFVYVSHEFFRELFDYKIAGDMTNSIALTTFVVSLAVAFVMLEVKRRTRLKNATT